MAAREMQQARGSKQQWRLMMYLETASTANITSGTTLQSNERFRRLIPYMTFYFAQQNYRNQPQYQDIQNAVPVLPVTNKLHVPQYQGNLVVPNSYLLRYNPRFRAAPRPPKPLEPRPFSPSKNNQEPLQPPRSYQLRITPSASDDSIKLTLSQILSLLQAIRKLPHIAPTIDHNTNPSQLYSVLPQTNHLPTNAGNNHIRGPPTQYTKFAPVSHIAQPLPTSHPKYVDNYDYFNSPISNAQIPKYTTKYYGTLPAISTTPAPLPQDDDYDTYDAPDPQPMVITTPKLSVKTTPSISTKIPLVQVSTPAPFQVANDLQNYDYSVEDLDSPHTEEPIREEHPVNDTLETTKPTIQDVTQNNDALQTYGYASKVPQYNHYHGHTTTQIFPDPSAEGGTPGRPGIDYPTYSRIPETSFSCKNQRYKGFFGDPETSCQVWHYCDLNGGQASFLCPNGTIFSQVGLTCDWWFNVRCASTAQLYVLNERLYKYILPVAPKFPEDYSGPLVDQYLTLKFQELENKKKNKEKNNKSGSGKQNQD